MSEEKKENVEEDLEFVKNVLEVKIYGEVYRLSFPTLKEIRVFTKNKDSDSIESMLKFLEKLGLKIEIAEEMELPHLKKIIGVLSSQKKS